MLEDKNFEPTPISKLGEFGLINRITSSFKIKNPQTFLAVGDDAAVLDFGGSHYHLLATDLLTEGIHYDMRYVPLKHLGYKCAAVNFSDIFAMNGKPLGITVAVAVNSRFSVEAMDELYEGIRFACEDFKVDLLGGDTSASASGSFISVTVIGSVEKNRITLRSTAQEKDLICVSGDLGAAFAGLQVLQRELKVFQSNAEIQPELESYDYVVGRQLKPRPRKDIIDLFKELDILPTAMIDVSDGLASDILHLSSQSKLGARVFQDKIQIDHQTTIVADEFKISPLTYALNGGEDYELLFTVKASEFDKIKSIREISIIGHMTADGTGAEIHLSGGETVPLSAQGWNHFR